MGLIFDAIKGFIAVLGMICGTLCVSLIGLYSIFSPESAEKLFQRLQEWANGE
tara:strand:+ start:13 stop:171 length:159 start_codon:yes stop_codon:yes gene_type:complete